jgi:hypothetical protein
MKRKSASAPAGAATRPDRVDRSAIRKLLKLSPAERARLAVEEARNLAAFDQRVRRSK